jgi:hypothetical protein
VIAPRRCAAGGVARLRPSIPGIYSEPCSLSFFELHWLKSPGVSTLAPWSPGHQGILTSCARWTVSPFLSFGVRLGNHSRTLPSSCESGFGKGGPGVLRNIALNLHHRSFNWVRLKGRNASRSRLCEVFHSIFDIHPHISDHCKRVKDDPRPQATA